MSKIAVMMSSKVLVSALACLMLSTAAALPDHPTALPSRSASAACAGTARPHMACEAVAAQAALDQAAIANTGLWVAISQAVTGALTLAAAVAAAIYAGRAAEESKASAKEAKTANEIAKETFREERQPWVFATCTPLQGITIDQDGLPTIYTAMELKNIGTVPARAIVKRCELFDISQARPLEPLLFTDTVLRNIGVQHVVNSFDILPGASATINLFATFRGAPPEILHGLIIACVGYCIGDDWQSRLRWATFGFTVQPTSEAPGIRYDRAVSFDRAGEQAIGPDGKYTSTLQAV